MRKIVFIFVFLSSYVLASYKAPMIKSYGTYGSKYYSIVYNEKQKPNEKLRLFVPEFTKTISFTMSTLYSQGNIIAYVSLNGNSLDSVKSALSQEDKKISGNYIYGIDATITSQYNSVTLFKELLTNNSVLYTASPMFIVETSLPGNELIDQDDKFVYIAHETGKLENGNTNNMIHSLTIVQMMLDKDKVDQKAQSIQPYTKCNSEVAEKRNICNFVAFLNDKINHTSSPVSVPVVKNLFSGWNLVGPHSFSQSYPNSFYMGSNGLVKTSSAIPSRMGMFIYSVGSNTIKFFQSQDYQPQASYSYKLKKGWNLLAAYKNGSIKLPSCVGAAYKYKSSQWSSFENNNNTTLNLEQNDGFYVYANESCNLTY